MMVLHCEDNDGEEQEGGGASEASVKIVGAKASKAQYIAVYPVINHCGYCSLAVSKKPQAARPYGGRS